jgi:AraC-like DNA-binding protein
MKRNSARSHFNRQQMAENHYEIYHFVDKNVRNVSLHHHDFYEIFYFIEGDNQFYIEGENYVLKSGDMLLINPTELHQCVVYPSKKEYERIVFWLKPDFVKMLSSPEFDLLSCFHAKDRKKAISINVDARRDIESLFARILEMENFQGVGKNIMRNALVMELLVKINNLVIDKQTPVVGENRMSLLIKDVISYIEENLKEDLTLEVLANQFFISKFHLAREFKKYSSVSIHQYIKLKRLILAKEHILKNESILDVYVLCGFGDYSNFFRAFKQEYDMTPRQFYHMMTQPNK